MSSRGDNEGKEEQGQDDDAKGAEEKPQREET
jgi:hypothetical protein